MMKPPARGAPAPCSAMHRRLYRTPRQRTQPPHYVIPSPFVTDAHKPRRTFAALAGWQATVVMLENVFVHSPVRRQHRQPLPRDSAFKNQSTFTQGLPHKGSPFCLHRIAKNDVQPEIQSPG